MINNKIQSGDFFKLNGFTYECVGTDDSLIWYEEPSKMDSVSADPQDCQLTHKYINHLLTPYRESAEEVLTPEQCLRKYFKTKDNSDINWMPEVIQAMEDYKNQFNQSLPLSKEEVERENELREQGWDMATAYLSQLDEEIPDKQTWLSSFLPKKP